MSELTREQIMEMAPGPHMDELVAGRVMNWRVYGSKINKDGYIAYLADFKPSTDISSAWEVVEKVNDGQHEVQIIKAPYYDDAVWIVTITKCLQTEDGLKRFKESSIEFASITEAICKAALLSTLEV